MFQSPFHEGVAAPPAVGQHTLAPVPAVATASANSAVGDPVMRQAQERAAAELRTVQASAGAAAAAGASAAAAAGAGAGAGTPDHGVPQPQTEQYKAAYEAARVNAHLQAVEDERKRLTMKEAAESKLEEEHQRLTADIAQLEHKEAELKALVDTKREELARLKDQIATLQSDIADKQREIDACRQDIIALTEEIRTVEAQLTELNRQMELANQAILATQTLLRQNIHDATQIDAELKVCAGQIQHATQAESKAASAANAAATALAAAIAKQEQTQKALLDAQNAHAAATANEQLAIQNAHELRQDLNAANAKLSDDNAKVAGLERQVQALRAEFDSVKASTWGKVCRFFGGSDGTAERRSAIQSKINSVESQLTAAKTEQTAHAQKVDQLKREVRDAEGKRVEARTKAVEARNVLTAAGNSLDAAIVAVRQAQEAKTATANALVTAEGALKYLQVRQLHLQSSHQQKTAAVAESERLLQDHTTKSQAVKAELGTKSAKVDALRAKIANAADVVKTKESELKGKQNEFDKTQREERETATALDGIRAQTATLMERRNAVAREMFAREQAKDRIRKEIAAMQPEVERKQAEAAKMHETYVTKYGGRIKSR